MSAARGIGMVIQKIFNNNAILVKDIDKHEFVVMGCGIAFKKSLGQEVDKNKIEKTFILKQNDASEKFKLLLEDIPTQHVSVCYDIIEYAKNMLSTEFNDYIYVTLTDHISHAIKLHDEGISTQNVLLWEIKKFYPKEFQVGLKAIEFVEEEIGKRLQEDEAGNIALHLINAQSRNGFYKIEDVAKQTKMVQDIMNIVIYTFNVALDEKSLNYGRFITHLRFFFQRLGKEQKDEMKLEDDFILRQVKSRYKKAYGCMLKIEEYLGTGLSDEEKLYLTIHIQRVTHR